MNNFDAAYWRRWLDDQYSKVAHLGCFDDFASDLANLLSDEGLKGGPSSPAHKQAWDQKYDLAKGFWIFSEDWFSHLLDIYLELDRASRGHEFIDWLNSGCPVDLS